MERARRMSADAAVAKMIKYHARSGLCLILKGILRLFLLFFTLMCFNRLVNMCAKFQANMLTGSYFLGH